MTQAKYAYIEDLSAPGESVHLIFGAAFAYGLEVARRMFHDNGASAQDAVTAGMQAAEGMYGDFEPPHKSPKTRDAVGKAVRYYFTIWPLDSDPVQPSRGPDGKLRVEWRFKVPIPDLVHPDDRGPIYYVGRSDMIPTMYNMPIIEDDKSATQLGDKWANQWPLDSQFIGYVWAAQHPDADGNPPILLNPQEPGTALIRGVGVYVPKYVKPGTDTPVRKVTESQIANGEVAYDLMTSFGHSQAIVHHSPWIVDRWLRQLKRDIGRLIYAYENDDWDLALHKGACGAYGGCAYQTLCMSQNPDQYKEIHFIKRKWDPLSTV